MGFSIGSLISSAAPLIGGAIGASFGSPQIGAALGSAVGAGFAGGGGGSVGPMLASASARGRGAIAAGLIKANDPASEIPISFQLAMARSPGRAIITRALGEGVLSVADILRRSRESGRRGVTSAKIKTAARVCGLDAAAATFGLSVQQVCFIVVNSRSRRSRGISSSDLRRTRSTIRKISSMQRNLKALSTGRRC